MAIYLKGLLSRAKPEVLELNLNQMQFRALLERVNGSKRYIDPLSVEAACLRFRERHAGYKNIDLTDEILRYVVAARRVMEEVEALKGSSQAHLSQFQQYTAES